MIDKIGNYYSSDPFFIVKCNKCGKEVYSTRRNNYICSKCGSTDIKTSVPYHTIEKHKK